MKLRIISVLLAVLLVIGTVSFNVSAKDTTVSPMGATGNFSIPGELSKYCDVDALRAYLLTEFSKGNDSVDLRDFKIPFTSENANFLFDFLVHQVPEFFYISSNAMDFEYSNNCIANISISRNYSFNDCVKMQAEIDKAVERTYGDIIGAKGLSDFEKAVLLCDRLANSCSYDTSSSVPAWSFSMYGALVNGIAVCQGYSEAYCYLLNKIGIKNEITASDALDHAWNIIYLDGDPYHADITWADDDVYGTFNRDYVFKSSEYFRGSHNANDYYAPKGGTKYNDILTTHSKYELINGKIYYADNSNSTIYSVENGEAQALFTGNYKQDTWPYSLPFRFFTDGDNILFEASYTIRRLNLMTGELESVYTVPYSTYPNHVIANLSYGGDVIYCTLINPISNTTTDISVPYDKTQNYGPETPSVPSDPTDPSEPSLPTDGTKPTKPPESTEPTAPTTPSLPADPTEPTAPTEGSEPIVPTVPTEGSEPTAPTVPTEGSKPTVPTVPSLPIEPSTPSYAGLILGDANGDETINIKDATAIQKHVAMLLTLTEVQRIAADVDSDGKLSIKDATAIQKYIVGIEVKYPIGNYT